MARYGEVRDQLATGDVLLFAGRGLVSRIIRTAQSLLGGDAASPWSHVGMVYWAGDICCVFESTTLTNVPDLFLGAPFAGVQVVPLSRRLRLYDGTVAWRPLRPSPVRLDNLRAFRLNVCHTPYEDSLLALWQAVYDGWLGGEVTHRPPGAMRSWFCSELVAAAYQAMGILYEEPPAVEYTPADFAPGGAVDRRCHDAKLGPPVTLLP